MRGATFVASLVLCLSVSCSLTLGLDGLLFDQKETGAGGQGGAGGSGPSSSSMSVGSGDATSSATGPGGAGGTSSSAMGGGGAGGIGGTYVDQVMADAPLAYWRFGETSGPMAMDSSGNGRTATYTGTITYGEPGAIFADANTAVRLGGVAGSYVVHNLAFDDFINQQPYTIEAWLKADAFDATYRFLYSKEDNPVGGLQQIGLFVHDGEFLGFERHVDGTDSQVSAGLPPPLVWTHMVGTYDGALMRFYVNGMNTDTAADARPLAPKPVPSYIGGKNPTSGTLTGALDEFAIYGTALPLMRIQAHYQAGIGN